MMGVLIQRPAGLGFQVIKAYTMLVSNLLRINSGAGRAPDQMPGKRAKLGVPRRIFDVYWINMTSLRQTVEHITDLYKVTV